MARPKKNGFEYFSKDTNVFSDRKIKRLIRECGAEGYMVYDFILCEIYRDNGYYVDFDDDYCFDIADTFNVLEDRIREIIVYCCTIGLFDLGQYEQGILTSKGIQKRWLEMNNVSKRSGRKIDSEKSLVDAEKKKVNSETKQKQSEETVVTSEETPQTSEETPQNSGENPQSKVKESKVKESKVDKISKTQKAFYDSLIPFVERYGKDMIREFYNYWSEPNKSKTKIRQQLEKTWDLKRRLDRWAGNNFGKPSIKEAETSKTYTPTGVYERE